MSMLSHIITCKLLGQNPCSNGQYCHHNGTVYAQSLDKSHRECAKCGEASPLKQCYVVIICLKLDLAIYVYNPNTWEIEAEGLGV